MLEHAIAAFVQEARDILAQLEDQLLSLEQHPDPAQIDAIFRGLHTIKGSGAMFGYTALARFTHHFENAFEQVRSGRLPVDRPLIDLALEAADQIGDFLALGGDGPQAEALLASPNTGGLIARIQALTGSAHDAPSKPATPPAEQDAACRSWLILFRPAPDALKNGMRPDLLLDELAHLGEIEVGIDVSALPPLETLDPALCGLGWRIELRTDRPRAEIEDVFIFADDADLKIELVAEAASDEPASAVNLSATAGNDKSGRPNSEMPRPQKPADNIRIASSRLDDMMDSIGELVIAQARLDAVSDSLGDSTLGAVVEEVGRLVLGLRDATLSIRMLPIETVFGKFRRVVRDLSTELGKDVNLVTSGGETEVDKNVIDRIGDPLVHMIRNSLDHGLETAEARRAAGKPETGTVRLSARQEGGEILISIEDDGRGLDTGAIRARAIERGLIDPDVETPERDLHQMIFEPGFSTAKTVSAVSGRGVGMDAVRSAIDGLGGSIDIVSIPGQGARITLRLPVTMAIIDGLRVRLGTSIFVIPLSAVEECVEMDAREADRASGRSVLQIREHIVPYLTLDALFGLSSAADARRRVVVVRVDGQRIGLVVDDILGQGQTVIKALSPYHRDIPGLGGATILGDGRVALIIDTATLVRWAEARHGAAQRKVA